MKLQTPVILEPAKVQVGYCDKILMLGSCFSDYIGKALKGYGFDVLVNPFGTLYNPISILNSLRRLASGEPFSASECVPMGANAGKICSFSHHTSFARLTAEEFLEGANSALAEASAFFASCNKIIITLGTAYVFETNNCVVSNCLKRPAGEFTRYRLSIEQVTEALKEIIRLCEGKQIIFTVSPIRHLADGAHGNQLSKSTLLMAIDRATGPAEGVEAAQGVTDYFPAYEIVMDELRDYRFYAEDMLHPSAVATAHILERFLERHLVESDRSRLEEGIKAYKRSQHREE